MPLDDKFLAPIENDGGWLVSKQILDQLRAKQHNYNMKCVRDLQEMNETKIDDLINRGGTEGWSTEGELDALFKTY